MYSELTEKDIQYDREFAQKMGISFLELQMYNLVVQLHIINYKDITEENTNVSDKSPSEWAKEIIKERGPMKAGELRSFLETVLATPVSDYMWHTITKDLVKIGNRATAKWSLEPIC